MKTDECSVEQRLSSIKQLGEALLAGEPDRAFFHIKHRSNPATQPSAQELNAFMAELGYRVDIEDRWLELKRTPAGLYADQCAGRAWVRGPTSNRQIASRIAELMDTGARFFTNGILINMTGEMLEVPAFKEQIGPDPINNLYQMYILPEPFRGNFEYRAARGACIPILPFGLLESGYVAVDDDLLVMVWFLMEGDHPRFTLGSLLNAKRI